MCSISVALEQAGAPLAKVLTICLSHFTVHSGHSVICVNDK